MEVFAADNGCFGDRCDRFDRYDRFCCLDWDVVVVVAWLAVLDGRFFSKIFAC